MSFTPPNPVDSPDWTPEVIPGGHVLINKEVSGAGSYKSPVWFVGHCPSVYLAIDPFGNSAGLDYQVSFYTDSAGATAEVAQNTYSAAATTAVTDVIPVVAPYMQVTSTSITAYDFLLQVTGIAQGAKILPSLNSNILIVANGISCAVGSTTFTSPMILPGTPFINYLSSSANTRISIYDAPGGALTTPLYNSAVLAALTPVTAQICLSYGVPILTVINTGGAAASVFASLTSSRGLS